jgi:hypothetical protein
MASSKFFFLANNNIAHDTPREPTDMYSGSWNCGELSRTTDAYLDPRGYAAPLRTANPYLEYGSSSLSSSHPNGIPEVDMPDPHNYMYSLPNLQFPEIPEVAMPDMEHTPSATDPSGVSTENSPSGGFSEPDQDGSRFQCTTCLKTYDRRCDLRYESARLFLRLYLTCTTITSETNSQTGNMKNAT